MFATIRSMSPEPLKSLLQPAPKTLPNGNPLLLLLHGYGSNEHDLFGLANYLDDRLTIVAARGPLSIAGGGRAWYSLEFTERGMRQNLVEADSSIRMVRDLIADLRAQHAPTRVFIGGFSQGAIMSTSITLSDPSGIAGAVLMSGAILSNASARPGAVLPPFIQTHGTNDGVIPLARAHELRDQLVKAGATLEYHEYPMAHEINAECLEDVNTWLTAHIQATLT